MTQPSEIIITAEALESLRRTDDIDDRAITARADGRFNLRVGGELRRQLDAIVVRTGLTHSDVIIALERLASA